MTASERVPAACLVELEGETYVRIGGEEWQPVLVSREAFDARFEDIAEANDFLAALAQHPAAQTPGWQAGVAWMQSRQ